VRKVGYKHGDAADWRRRFRRLSRSSRQELLDILAVLNRTKDKKAEMVKHRTFAAILEHYYPDGQVLTE
jgi:hypothetical protein